MVTRPRDCSWVPNHFENIAPCDFKCSSDPENDYNCIAWAAGKTDRPWWPTTIAPYFWPPDLPTEPVEKAETLENFVKAFANEGYRICRDSHFSTRYEKVAIYVGANGRPTHAARTLVTGIWSSKLGDEEDIEHTTLECIEGRTYGQVAVVMRRKRPRGDGNLRGRLRLFLSRLFEKTRKLLSQGGNPTNS